MNWLSRPLPPRTELRGLELALVALPVAALPHAWHQPPWVTLLVAAALGIRAWIHVADRRAPSLGLMSLLALLAGILTLSQFGTVFGQAPGTALLLVMVAFKLLETRTRRDVVIALFLGYFVVATTYFFDQSPLIALYSLLATWLLTAALIQVHAGRRMPRPALARHAGAMLLQALPFMLILFVVFPRIQGPLWGDPHREETARTGLSGELNPGDIASLLQDEGTALRVRFEDRIPPTRLQYWRALVMTDFDGRRWRADRERPEVDPLPGATDPVAYTATLEPTRAHYLPVLDYPLELPDRAHLRDTYQVQRERRVTQRIQYSASASLTTPPGSIRGQLEPDERARALALPPDAAPRARTLVALWRATHGDDDRAVVQAALRRFAGEPYRYTLQPPRLQDDTTDAFLFESHAGYCEHYASAFAVLMRAAGIPARVVTGYQGGEWMERGDYLRLRNADAHAWNEVWLDGEGWIRVDPTAAIAPERIESGLGGLLETGNEDVPDFLRRDGLSWMARVRLDLRDWGDAVRFRWESWVLAFDPERQRELFARFGLDPRDWRGVLMALAIGLGTLALVAAAWFGAGRLRRRRDFADRVLDRAARRLARQDARLARHPHESAEAWARRAAARRPELAPVLEALVEHSNLLRFARLDESARAAHRAALRQALRQVPRWRRRPPRNDTGPARA
ncbi:MAG: transglutaminaseTgpA domain-containing protein [Pseudomonadota bacterium]